MKRQQRLITKHPDIADLEDLIWQALSAPDEIDWVADRATEQFKK